MTSRRCSVTREEAKRALDECHRELRALLKRYGARLEPELVPDEWERGEEVAGLEWVEA